ncbi:MAG: GNAT family N-acetyltransferase [Lewinella sp.]|nr:GNAT family N-acetyltransferase [Lewinella sp.]
MNTRTVSGMTIRKARPEDSGALAEMGQLAYRQHFSYLWTEEGLERYLENAYQPDFFEKTIRDENAVIWLALLESQICGYLIYHRSKSLSQAGNNGGYINRIYLLDHCAGMGLGSRLLHLAVDQGKADQKDYLWLEVMQSNEESIAFYQKQGFDFRGATAFTRFPMRTEALSRMWWMVKVLNA